MARSLKDNLPKANQNAQTAIHWGRAIFRIVLLGVMLALIVSKRGFGDFIESNIELYVIEFGLLLIYLGEAWWTYKKSNPVIAGIKPGRAIATFYTVMFISMIGAVAGYQLAAILFDISAAILLLVNLCWLNVGLARYLKKPGMLLPSSFFFLILMGTLLLKVPLATTAGPPLRWIDAAFTITSAVCVTGLIVRDTATAFTPFGQAIIALFIQIGGLGIIIFGSLFAAIIGSRSSLREDLSLSQALNDQPISQVNRLVKFIVGTSLLIELLGVIVMMPLFHGPMGFFERLGNAAFLSISAYCNAGFALKSNSLESYRYSFLAHGVVIPLLVIGGIGFPVMLNFYQVIRQRWTKQKCRPSERSLTLHTKLVLTTTAGLYLFGMLGIAASRLMPYFANAMDLNVTANHQVLGPLSLSVIGKALADSSFMSLTCRTAGFNTVDMTHLSSAESMIMMILMMVGGSPAGTAGGLKTTTFAVLLLSIWATIRQRPHTEAFGRRMGDSLVRKASTIAAAYIGAVSVGTLLLCFSEPFPFVKLLFEMISAVTVTGLSQGITSDLTSFGKVIIIIAMFLGRIGPLGLLISVFFGGRHGRPYAYPNEEAIIG